MTSERPVSSAHSGRDGHLSPIVLAEHAEGLLPPQQADGVDSHLRTCAACRNVSDALAAVSARLADAPRELPVPAAVTDRIATALAGEARTDRPAARASVVSLDSWTSRLRRRAPVLLGAAATVGAIGFAVYVINSDVLGGRSTDDSMAGISADEQALEAPDAPADSDDEATTLDQDAAAGAGDAPAEDTGDDAAGESLEEQRSALAPDDAKLMAEIQAVASGQSSDSPPASASDGCGASLADELGREVVGAATTDLVEPGSVLIVVNTDDPDSVEGWVLPTCDDGPEDALTSQEAPRR